MDGFGVTGSGLLEIITAFSRACACFLMEKCYMIPTRVCVPQMSERLLIASLPHTLLVQQTEGQCLQRAGLQGSEASRAPSEQLSLPDTSVLAPGQGVELAGIAGQVPYQWEEDTGAPQAYTGPVAGPS